MSFAPMCTGKTGNPVRLRQEGNQDRDIEQRRMVGNDDGRSEVFQVFPIFPADPHPGEAKAPHDEVHNLEGEVGRVPKRATATLRRVHEYEKKGKHRGCKEEGTAREQKVYETFADGSPNESNGIYHRAASAERIARLRKRKATGTAASSSDAFSHPASRAGSAGTGMPCPSEESTRASA